RKPRKIGSHVKRIEVEQLRVPSPNAGLDEGEHHRRKPGCKQSMDSPGTYEGDRLRRNGMRKLGTARRLPRLVRASTAKAAHITRSAGKLRGVGEWGGWGRLSDDGPGQQPVWHILEGEFELVLANPLHIRNVPGRKSDVNDATWIADLL